MTSGISQMDSRLQGTGLVGMFLPFSHTVDIIYSALGTVIFSGYIVSSRLERPNIVFDFRPCPCSFTTRINCCTDSHPTSLSSLPSPCSWISSTSSSSFCGCSPIQGTKAQTQNKRSFLYVRRHFEVCTLTLYNIYANELACLRIIIETRKRNQALVVILAVSTATQALGDGLAGTGERSAFHAGRKLVLFEPTTSDWNCGTAVVGPGRAVVLDIVAVRGK
jgi:hypothetical protein